MLNLFHAMFRGLRNPSAQRHDSHEHAPAPLQVCLPGVAQPFLFGQYLTDHCGFPIADWDGISQWVEEQATEEVRKNALASAKQVWLLHFREALGDKYSLIQSDSAALISPLEGKIANATLEYLNRTRIRVSKVLDGIAEFCVEDKDILIVFENEEQYYEYISFYYPDEGDFATSSGIFLSEGCAHFVIAQSDLHAIEPIIAHEMTHAGLAHLSLPLWLDEGLAVNLEGRLSMGTPNLYTPVEMRAMHSEFWGEDEIQQFWSGESFARTDEGNLLSYDLARILVEQFSRNWADFKDFVLAADRADSGAAAARLFLGVQLGSSVAALLEKAYVPSFEPAAERCAAS